MSLIINSLYGNFNDRCFFARTSLVSLASVRDHLFPIIRSFYQILSDVSGVLEQLTSNQQVYHLTGVSTPRKIRGIDLKVRLEGLEPPTF